MPTRNTPNKNGPYQGETPKLKATPSRCNSNENRPSNPTTPAANPMASSTVPNLRIDAPKFLLPASTSAQRIDACRGLSLKTDASVVPLTLDHAMDTILAIDLGKCKDVFGELARVSGRRNDTRSCLSLTFVPVAAMNIKLLLYTEGVGSHSPGFGASPYPG
jgi:hypothetical protein